MSAAALSKKNVTSCKHVCFVSRLRITIFYMHVYTQLFNNGLLEEVIVTTM